MITIRNNRTKETSEVTEEEFDKIQKVFPGRFSKVKRISKKSKDIIEKVKSKAKDSEV
jgi:hypothetical protein